VHHQPAPAGAPTLLLLHGLGITAAAQWFTAFPALVERFGVVAPDLRSHGRGIRSREPFSLEACADDAAATLTELGIDEVVVVGYSMGCPVAQLFWHRHPDRTTGLVHCAGVHSYRGLERGPSRGGPLAPTVHALQIARFLVQHANPGRRRWLLGQLRRNDRKALYAIGPTLGAYDSSAWLGGIDVPHAVVLTERDQVVPPDRQELVIEALPAPTVHRCDADHGDALAEPNVFLPALLEAVEAVTP
jgi:pimeloyl-ACP methyl ester carboxylesterase